MKVERNSYALSLKKWKFDVKNCEVEVIILVKRNAFHDFYSERHSNLCGKLVNFRTLCNCYIIPNFLTALFIKEFIYWLKSLRELVLDSLRWFYCDRLDLRNQSNFHFLTNQFYAVLLMLWWRHPHNAY